MKKTIKHIYVIGLLVFSVNNYIHAQEKHLLIGSRIGIGESMIEFEDLYDEKSRIALTAGISTNYHFNRFIGLGADFMLTTKGGKYTNYTSRQDIFGNNVQYNYRDQYDIYTFDIPLSAKLRIPLSETFAIKAFAGPNFQFTLLGNETRTYDDRDFQTNNGYTDRKLKDLNTMEYGLQYGLGLEVGNVNQQTFFIDFRVNESLTELGKIQGLSAKSSNYLISIGYLF